MGMLKSTRALARASFLGLFLFLAGLAFPANIVVPKLDLITRGSMNGGAFTLQTFGDITLEVQGGYKFGGSLSVNVQSLDLENFTFAPLPFPWAFSRRASSSGTFSGRHSR